MHGDPNPANCSADALGCGWEVMPSNVKWTADHLLLASDEFDYTQPSPQAAAWKTWAKYHLVREHAIAFLCVTGATALQFWPDPGSTCMSPACCLPARPPRSDLALILLQPDVHRGLARLL